MKLVQDFVAVLIYCKSDKDSSQLKSLSSRQHFQKPMGSSGRVTLIPVIETEPKSNLQEILLVLIIFKFDEDPIKNKVATVWTTFSPLYVYGRQKAGSSHKNNLICPKIKLVQDFMAVLITCKSDEDSIKNEIAIVQTTFF